jgi:DNA-binding response OmpR family regulator
MGGRHHTSLNAFSTLHKSRSDGRGKRRRADDGQVHDDRSDPAARDGGRAATHPGRRKVLVVDDEEQVRTVVAWQLESEDFEVEEAADGDAALRQIISGAPDLVVLDLSLPGKGGLEVLATVRRAGGLPVIVLTARRDEIERVIALDLGADDYVVKPFSPRELAARVRSVLRRSTPAPAARVLEYGPLRIDLDARDVWVSGRRIELTAKEFDLLGHLAAAPRRTFTRSRLLADVWSSSPQWQVEATVTEHMRRLRLKIEPDPGRPRWLRTVRSVGYRFEPEPEA